MEKIKDALLSYVNFIKEEVNVGQAKGVFCLVVDILAALGVFLSIIMFIRACCGKGSSVIFGFNIMILLLLFLKSMWIVSFKISAIVCDLNVISFIAGGFLIANALLSLVILLFARR